VLPWLGVARCRCLFLSQWIRIGGRPCSGRPWRSTGCARRVVRLCIHFGHSHGSGECSLTPFWQSAVVVRRWLLEQRTAISIADTQQVLPLPKVALETHALGNLKRRYDASLDVLGSLACAVRRRIGIPGTTGRDEPDHFLPT